MSLTILNLLRTIKERGSVSRTELQQLTGLSWGTITNTTRALLNRNLVREEAAMGRSGAGGSGRKPVRLTINPSSHSLVGVDIGRHMVRCTVLNLAGQSLWYEEFTFTQDDEPIAVLERAAGLVRDALQTPELADRICLGVGVGAPGALDLTRGTLRHASQMPKWREVPIRETFQKHVRANVFLEHDPNCLTMAERWFGEAGRAHHVLCVNLTDGVGMGVLIDGDIYRGSQHLAGEFGHTTVAPDGPACGCGDNGCVEAFASIRAVLEYITAAPDKQSSELAQILRARTPTLAEIVAAAKNGDEAARGAFERMGIYLGVGLANLVDVFNPDLIILAGPLTAAREFFMPLVDQQVAKRAWCHSNRQILISQLGERAMAMGACGIVLQSLFEQDVLSEPALLRA